MIYLGIDPTAGRRPLNYAMLDSSLALLAEGECQPADLLQLIAPYPDVVCAVDAPGLPNKGLMAHPAVRAHLGLPPDSETWAQYRVCEYELRRRNIKLYNTPTHPAKEPTWMKAGWKLYDQLRAAGFQTYPAVAPRTFFEVHPHATFTALLGVVPYDKTTLEGRWQRQLLLFDEGVCVPDAMEFFEEITRHSILEGAIRLNGLRTHDQLDALASALTAHYAHTRPDQITLVGDPADGQIVVPVRELKERYL